MLFTCVFVPFFPIQTVMRNVPETSQSKDKRPELPVALVEAGENIVRVVLCNEAASACGIEAGMTKTQAEQFGALIRDKSASAEQSAQSALIECAFSFSPRVESTAPGIVTLDIAGLERLFGSPAKINSALQAAAASLGLKVNVATAHDPDTALIAARGIEGVSVVPQGQEEQCLGPLSIDVLSPSPEDREILEEWGIQTCKDLAKILPVPLTERLGQEGLRLWKLTRGELRRSLVPFDPPRRFQEVAELEEPVELLEPLLFVINRLLENILEKLNARALFVQELHLELSLDVRSEDWHINQARHKEMPQTFERTLALPVPMQDPKTLLKLLHLDLEAHPPHAPILRIALTAEPARPRYTQGNLFLRAAPEAEKVEVLQAKLRSIVGETDMLNRNTVGAPGMVDSHEPDSFKVLPFMASCSEKKALPAPQSEEDMLRIYRPPRSARVRVARDAPVHIAFSGISSAILQSSGPWRCAGSWWKKKWEREFWDIELRLTAGLAQYRIYRDVLTNGWFVAGKVN
jgi:protein ImuB